MTAPTTGPMTAVGNHAGRALSLTVASPWTARVPPPPCRTAMVGHVVQLDDHLK
jgi:hypothetical protein